VPIASVTTRLPRESTNNPVARTNQLAQAEASGTTNSSASSPTDTSSTNQTNLARTDKKGEGPKPVEVVFVVEGDKVKMRPVKRGISDDAHVEITDGLSEGQEVVSGGYKAISRELEDGKKIKKGEVKKDNDKEKK
jgi:HlyD family secretion protein